MFNQSPLNSSVVFAIDMSPPRDVVQPPNMDAAGLPPISMPVTEPLKSAQETVIPEMSYSPGNSVSHNVLSIQKVLKDISDAFHVCCIGILMDTDKGVEFEVDDSLDDANCSVAFFHLPGGVPLSLIRGLIPDKLLNFSSGLKVDSAYLAKLSSEYDGVSFLQFDPRSGASGLLMDSEGTILEVGPDSAFRDRIILILPFISGEVDIPIAVDD